MRPFSLFEFAGLKAFAFGEILCFCFAKRKYPKKRRPQVAAKARPKTVRPRRLGNSLVATAPYSNTPRLKTLATQFCPARAPMGELGQELPSLI
jgi:hypothetical protein